MKAGDTGHKAVREKIAPSSIDALPQGRKTTDVFAGGGELGARLRAIDWSQTPLGPVDAWPQDLCIAIGICLAELNLATASAPPREQPRAPRPTTEQDTGEKLKALRHAEQRAQRLAAERDRLQQVLDVLPEGIQVVDATGTFILSNQAATKILGIDVTGQRLPFDERGAFEAYGLRRPDGAPYPAEALPLQRALLHGEEVHGDQELLRHAIDGRDIPVLANGAPLRDATGAIVGAVSVFQDISAIKDLERQKDDFLATISHDLKNPLTAINGMAQVMQLRLQRLDGPEAELARTRQGLDTISMSAAQMTRMLAELVDITRLHMARPLDLELDPTDLVALIQRVVKVYWQATKQHALRVQTTQAALIAVCDAARMERVLGNLLANAIKYSPHGGTITIQLTRKVDHSQAGADWAEITVTDQGIGIPKEAIPHVFERFYRADNVVGQIAGTGIGLAGARLIVEQHGGTIEIASAQGAGTTVTIRLPLSGPYARAHRTPLERQPPTGTAEG